MPPKLPQYNNSYELGNNPPSGIGEAAQARYRVVQEAVHNGFTGLAGMLPKPEAQVNPASYGAQPERYQQYAATQPVRESAMANPAPAYPAETYSQHVATNPAEEGNFLKAEDARNYIGQLHDEMERDRLAQQAQPSNENKDTYGLAA